MNTLRRNIDNPPFLIMMIGLPGSGKSTYGEEIEIDMNLSITFLADMLGVPRETASRACSMLIDYGLIKMEKKRIIIVNAHKMSAFYRNGKI